jgi:hypothetical protein
MGFVVIIPIAALAGWSILSMYRRLKRGAFEPGWWRAFANLGCAGLALGFWFAFVLEYPVARKRIAGFPIPVGISDQDANGRWVKAIPPGPVHYAGVATDLISGVAVALAPLAIAAFFKGNTGRRDEHGKRLI